MTKAYRLIFFLVSFAALIIVGYVLTGAFEFLLNEFWFNSGLLLLLSLSLIDQPHFSKDANIFVNSITAFMSLVLVKPQNRDWIWALFLGWVIYLLVTSYSILFLRKQKLASENRVIQLISRINREIGKPEALFSAFFLWGVFLSYQGQPAKISPLLIFWAIFIILNFQTVSNSIEALFRSRIFQLSTTDGVITAIVHPDVAIADLRYNLQLETGPQAFDVVYGSDIIGSVILIDDRIISGTRTGKLRIHQRSADWANIAIDQDNPIELRHRPLDIDLPLPISVVDVGSTIGRTVFFVNPEVTLQEGEVIWLNIDGTERAYYQIVSVEVTTEFRTEKNIVNSLRVSASQLGRWNSKWSRFETVSWVPSPGSMIHVARDSSNLSFDIPAGHIQVGTVPNSSFPIHVNIDDIVTHNSAIIGVTGSGKSYLAFHLIESLIEKKIKVLILDISRQHFVFLSELNPTPLKASKDVATWLDGDSMLGIHQFGQAVSYPKVTAEFAEAVFNHISGKTKLKPGINEPARICMIFEEAHSLIPEWNQVAMPSDKDHVNKTASVILQGRKYGLGSIVITQRTANVTKTILNQCNTMFALRSYDQTGLDFLRNYMGEEYSQTISTLPTHHSILVGKASSSSRPVMFKVLDLKNRYKETEPEEA
ncbi:MAG: hypothetical protein LDLANPLL_01813 [Turneriella sp.]|nr:hypothetical protein [Turneriella sp.]